MPVATVRSIALAAGFIAYPVFNDSGATIEAIIDRGTITEIVVRCWAGTAIIAYSKVEKRYCSPRWKCGKDLDAAIEESCR
jgi:hypothetical protein